MRLDKYLKVSRLVKRRTVAKQIADQGRILINQKVAKSSSNVVVGDQLTLKFGNRLLIVKVVSLNENAKKNEASELYQIIKEKS
ncbi:RNA-binding S4 domain-containing protein [Liquorilactobacillus sicerae]|uniref:RNA-binding S4 domain-containing protein n=1 Tax=Liquorilactobacillus sicerae TaxID=1416943 RepID=UPI00248185BE|nr:RNA-binding S4 domain-containing protein [Liquorilactobacillus sicerae]